MNDEAKIVGDVISAFDPNGAGPRPNVPKASVLEWMQHPSLEVRGATYTMVSDETIAPQITPHLTFDDYYQFVTQYLCDCIQADPKGEWADSRYLAAHQLVGWIVHFWNDNTVPRQKIGEIKDRLAELYVQGDTRVRNAIVNGVLEHLFEHKPISKFFGNWQADSRLADAYKIALQWEEKKLM